MKRRWLRNLVIYLLIGVWTLWPIFCVMLSYFLAWMGNAQVDEGNSHPCIILGYDFGTLVGFMCRGLLNVTHLMKHDPMP